MFLYLPKNHELTISCTSLVIWCKKKCNRLADQLNKYTYVTTGFLQGCKVRLQQSKSYQH